MQTYINVRPKRAVWIVFALLAGIYLLLNLGLLRGLGTLARSYIVPALLWGLLALVVLALPKYKPTAKSSLRSTIIQVALMIGFVQVVVYAIGGLFSNFGKSPYSFTPLNILQNLLLVTATLIGMEVSRAWLINNLGKKHTFLALALVALLYTGLYIPMSQITGIKLEVETISFLNSTLLPTLVENLLASLLALLAGPLASIAYRGILEAFWWFCPVLPDLPWALKGLIGVAVPIIGMVAVNSFYSIKSGRRRSRKQTEGGFPVGWIVTSIFALVIIWFSVGLFPFHPSLVGSGSMEPMMYAGDIVIVAKVPTDMIKEGDVIQFRHKDGITIMHRVIEIQETEQAVVYITKGDANDTRDADPVIPENVVGKLVVTIPKVGWAAVFIKSFFTG